jgi:hypothetical protein
VDSYGALVRARRERFARYVLAQHGAGQSYGGVRGTLAHQPGYPGGVDNGDVGLFLAPNEHAARRWREAYPKAKVAVVGCPKLDTLPHREGKPGRVVAISFHWKKPNPPEAGWAFDDFARAIPALRERFELIGHAHPLASGKLAAFYRHHEIEYVPAFEDVCRRADLYVCDNSSTIFEFASTGRPVVLMNARQYRRHVDHGLRFWTAASVGVGVDDPSDLGDTIEAALDDRHEAQREAALDVVYAYRTGATQRAAEAIAEFAA